MSDHDNTTKASDAEFDRALSALFAHPEDEDVAELSRAVLSQTVTVNRTRHEVQGDVLSEPLPWALGFGGLMAIGVALGYVLSSSAIGDGFLAWFAFGDLLSVMGGF
ncbi:hypothetical protein [Celeribacter naphthalenivorans]|uniref:hypothetical protein n=1 Tax=Celeribacter naphthalenivorans TaxID=1614694 RepID=UPI001CFBD107|nr:hypothetical protein [Celeribacter naphthalenivorans]